MAAWKMKDTNDTWETMCERAYAALESKPYKFNRADAYPEGELA